LISVSLIRFHNFVVNGRITRQLSGPAAAMNGEVFHNRPSEPVTLGQPIGRARTHQTNAARYKLLLYEGVEHPRQAYSYFFPCDRSVTSLSMDGFLIQTWYSAGLNADFYTYVTGFDIGRLTTGPTLRIDTDTTDVVPESNKNDNS
jgi:hypothetical protein